MVRFIIYKVIQTWHQGSSIYIPIWLDLLFEKCIKAIVNEELFTFQYG